jgi:phosphoglycerate dehydrogenase-like enzyme
MQIVLLQTKLSEESIRELLDEFPQYLFLAPTETSYKSLEKEDWSRVEIFYGNRLTPEELKKAHQLRWIHSPSPNLSPLCLSDIESQGNIILTVAKEENVIQIGEYVLGGILAFSKHLFQWKEADKNPTALLDSKWRESMWTLQNRILLQVGLGDVGSEIARRGKQIGMKVWGLQERRSFHPYCRKVLSIKELYLGLKEADVVSIALPRDKPFQDKLFKEKEFDLMKSNSILVIIGSKSIIDEEALAIVAARKKFRGILLDALYQRPIALTSSLWKIPNILITPEVAPRPKSEEKEAFKMFRYNFRQYLHGNFADMKISVNKSILRGPL